MNHLSLLDYLNAVGSIATPFLVLALTAIGWSLRTRLQRRHDLEDKLREDRIQIYNDILEPFVIMLMADAAWQSDPKNESKNKYEVASGKLLSLDYKKTGFRVTLMGSDEVVKTYSDLMQYFFQRRHPSTPPTEGDIIEMMSKLGRLILEIRKSMGNETTKLDNWEILEWFLTDARTYRQR